MPWQTPTLQQVRKNNRDYIAGKLGGGPLLANGPTRVLADANAGNAHLTYQYVDWLADQLLPDTAENEWLDRHAQIWVGGRKQATYASGTINLVGTIAGTVVPSGWQITINNGSTTVLYATTAPVTLAVGATPVAATALDPGSAGNSDPGTVASVTAALPGLNGQATVVSMQNGTDEESDDELRARILERIQKPPMGGDADDFVAWALQYPGVTRAWCSPLEMGPGTVTLRFMMDDLRPMLPAPTLTGVTTSTTGGTLAAGSYFYVKTDLNAAGETIGSNEVRVTATGTTSSNTITFPAANPGVVSSKIYRGTSAGAENVYFAVANNVTQFVDTGAAGTAGSVPTTNTATGNGFPLPSDVTAVQAWIDSLRPVAVKDCFVVAPIIEPINLTIHNLSPNNAATQAAIAASIAAMIANVGAPAYSQNGVAQPAQTIYAAWVSNAISAAAGVVSFDLIMTDHAMPSAGSMAVLGTITYA